MRLKEITLITCRDLAFNGRFYASGGFREIGTDQLPARLAPRLSGEAEQGLEMPSAAQWSWRCERTLQSRPVTGAFAGQ
jgi:hypothetical protein